MASGGIKLAPLLTEMKVDIKNFKSDMEQAKKAGKDRKSTKKRERAESAEKRLDKGRNSRYNYSRKRARADISRRAARP